MGTVINKIFFIATLLALNGLPEKIHADEVVVISNPKTPALKMRIVFKEELSIGEVEGDENYMFGSSIGFNTDDEGNFYVADFDSKRILKYDPEGEYTLLDIFDRDGKYIAHFKTPVFDDGMLSSILFFNSGKAYCVATEDDYRFAKRYSYEIQEYENNEWIKIK